MRQNECSAGSPPCLFHGARRCCAHLRPRRRSHFRRLTRGTHSLQFDFVAGDPVARVLYLRDERLAQFRLMQFGDVAALLADHENAVLALREVVADREGIDRLDAMYEPRRKQEVQRAIHRGRRRAWVDLAHFVEQRIRFGGAPRIQQQLQHFAADRREFLAAFATIFFRESQRGFGRFAMRVPRRVCVIMRVCMRVCMRLGRSGGLIRSGGSGGVRGVRGGLGVLHEAIIKANAGLLPEARVAAA